MRVLVLGTIAWWCVLGSPAAVVTGLVLLGVWCGREALASRPVAVDE